MRRITRRVFLKATAVIGATLAVGRYIDSSKPNPTAPCDSADAAPAGPEKLVTVVSDVDAHSQCKMRVSVKGGRVIEIGGDPMDPESKGELTARGKQMREIVYHSGDILGSYLRRLANLIGTPNVSNPSHVCHLPRVFLQFNYDFGAVVPPDVAHTNFIILWGGNPKTTKESLGNQSRNSSKAQHQRW